MSTAKFVVTWTITKWVSTECPDYKPDPYTGEYPMMHCLVNHGHFVDEEMSKVFEDKKEAIKFVANAPRNVKNMKMMEINQ